MLTVATRDELFAQSEGPPRALRCPPLRSPSEFVFTSLATPDGKLKPKVQSWLEHEGSRPQLEVLLDQYTKAIGPKWPSEFSFKTFRNMMRQTLLGLQPGKPRVNRTYLITTRLRLLHGEREQAVYAARGIAAEPGALAADASRIDLAKRNTAAFKGMCVHDHLRDVFPGPWFQLHLLYRLVLMLERLGVLETRPDAAIDCPICLDARTDAAPRGTSSSRAATGSAAAAARRGCLSLIHI
eukprot:6074007-Prymnesium_polylepis.2